MTDAERIALWRRARRYARRNGAAEYADDFASWCVIRSYDKPTTPCSWRLTDFRRQAIGRTRGKSLNGSPLSDASTKQTDPTEPVIMVNLIDLLSCLDAREREIILRCVLMDDEQQAVALSMGLTEGRISQIRKAALKKLKGVLCSV